MKRAVPSLMQDPAGAAALDIEHVDAGDDVPRIEMDLACGVLDLQVCPVCASAVTSGANTLKVTA